ncbi:MAG: DRTGG domain-containing protein [Oscillospiraceae bacterium]
MLVSQITELLDAKIHCGEAYLDQVVSSGCGCDMMSDALAFMKDQAVLMTGLINPQVIRTAEMMDAVCVVFVRGKEPTPAMIELASQHALVVLSTHYRLFQACGILYGAGLDGGGKI